jgi:hypothetical protein
MITEKITIRNLTVRPSVDNLVNVISAIHCVVELTDDELSKTVRRPMIIFPSIRSDTEFIDYLNVTEDDVISWIKADAKYVQNKLILENTLSNSIETYNSAVNVTSSRLPWKLKDILNYELATNIINTSSDDLNSQQEDNSSESTENNDTDVQNDENSEETNNK